MDVRPAPSPQPGGFEDFLGLEVVELGDELARGRLRVRAALMEAGGGVHAGVFAAIAQELASRATAGALAGDNRRATGLSNQTSLLAPISDGEIRAVAHRRHRGRSTWVWEVEMSDGRDQLCAFSRVTIEVPP